MGVKWGEHRWYLPLMGFGLLPLALSTLRKCFFLLSIQSLFWNPWQSVFVLTSFHDATEVFSIHISRCSLLNRSLPQKRMALCSVFRGTFRCWDLWRIFQRRITRRCCDSVEIDWMDVLSLLFLCYFVTVSLKKIAQYQDAATKLVSDPPVGGKSSFPNIDLAVGWCTPCSHGTPCKKSSFSPHGHAPLVAMIVEDILFMHFSLIFACFTSCFVWFQVHGPEAASEGSLMGMDPQHSHEVGFGLVAKKQKSENQGLTRKGYTKSLVTRGFHGDILGIWSYQKVLKIGAPEECPANISWSFKMFLSGIETWQFLNWSQSVGDTPNLTNWFLKTLPEPSRNNES